MKANESLGDSKVSIKPKRRDLRKRVYVKKGTSNREFVADDAVTKSLRDRRLVKKHARYVIVMDQEGHCAIRRHPHGHLQVIAVLAHDWIDEQELPESVVLEIGISQSRPYRRSQPESKSMLLSGRKKARALSKQEVVALWPSIHSIFEEVMRGQRQAQTRSRNPFKAVTNGSAYIIRDGPTFTVELEEVLLCRIIRALHFRSLEKIPDQARILRKWLKKYKYVNYTKKEIRNMPNAVRALELWSLIRNPLQQHVILRLLGSQRDILLGLLQSMDMPRPEPERSEEVQEFLRFEKWMKKNGIRLSQSMGIYITRENEGDQSRNRIIFEVQPRLPINYEEGGDIPF